MRFLNLVGNSFGCSASGERLVSAARDGDFQEAKALLDYNPRLARYSTFGARNSPLHYSSAQGHNEIVALLLEFGVDINLRNYRGQTALMQACQYGHWEVVQTLILFKANIHKADYLNGGTALHLAALNGHSRCIRLLLADYVPSVPNFFSRSKNSESVSEFDEGYLVALHEVINRPADGGVTALHMAALNGHAEAVQLLLDLGSSVFNKTVEDGTTIDLIGPGSTPLHYAACGGNAQCCQLLIARGASLTTENVNRWTPLMVARSWHRDWLEDVLNLRPESQTRHNNTSPYLCLPLRSIVDIARQCGWRSNDSLSSCLDPCVVCLERKCTVAAEGCFHEFCTRCALYLCSTNTTSTTNHAPPGSIACPLCRNGIVSFTKLASTRVKEIARTTSLSLPFCSCSVEDHEFNTLETPFCKPDITCGRIAPMGSFRSLSCQRFNPGLCLRKTGDSGLRNELVRCSRLSFRRSTSQNEGRRWLCSFSQSMETESMC